MTNSIETTATLVTDNFYRKGFHYENECWVAGTKIFWLIIDLKAIYDIYTVGIVRGSLNTTGLLKITCEN